MLPGVASRVASVSRIRYRNTFQSLSLIAREEGWQALWKGYAPKLARLGPGGGILLVAFDAFSSVARTHLM